MASDYLGTGSWLMAGKESAWGTPVARTTSAEAVSIGLKRSSTLIQPPHLVAASTPFMPKTKHEISREAGGAVEMLLRYRGLGLWLEAAMGAVADTGAGAPYTHTFTLGDPTALPSLTVEAIRGTSGNSEVFAGLLIAKMVLSWNEYQHGRLRFETLAKSAADRAAAGSATAGDDVPILGSHGATFLWNGSTYILRSLDLTLDNKLQRRGLLGSLYTARPLPSDLRVVSARLVVDADDDWYAAQEAGTESDGVIVFTGTGHDTLTATIENAFVNTCDDPLSAHGRVSQTIELLGQSDGTNHGLKLVLTNEDALYSVN